MTATVSHLTAGQKIYIHTSVRVVRRPMFDRIRTAALFGLHQATVAIGISLFPVAVFARKQLGINVPIGRLVETTGEVYEATEE